MIQDRFFPIVGLQNDGRALGGHVGNVLAVSSYIGEDHMLRSCGGGEAAAE